MDSNDRKLSYHKKRTFGRFWPQCHYLIKILSIKLELDVEFSNLFINRLVGNYVIHSNLYTKMNGNNNNEQFILF